MGSFFSLQAKFKPSILKKDTFAKYQNNTKTFAETITNNPAAADKPFVQLIESIPVSDNLKRKLDVLMNFQDFEHYSPALKYLIIGQWMLRSVGVNVHVDLKFTNVEPTEVQSLKELYDAPNQQPPADLLMLGLLMSNALKHSVTYEVEKFNASLDLINRYVAAIELYKLQMQALQMSSKAMPGVAIASFALTLVTTLLISFALSQLIPGAGQLLAIPLALLAASTILLVAAALGAAAIYYKVMKPARHEAISEVFNDQREWVNNEYFAKSPYKEENGSVSDFKEGYDQLLCDCQNQLNRVFLKI